MKAFNFVILKVVAGIGVISFSALLFWVLAALVDYKGKLLNISFKVALTGIIFVILTLFIIATINIF